MHFVGSAILVSPHPIVYSSFLTFPGSFAEDTPTQSTSGIEWLALGFGPAATIATEETGLKLGLEMGSLSYH